VNKITANKIVESRYKIDATSEKSQRIKSGRELKLKVRRFGNAAQDYVTVAMTPTYRKRMLLLK
jgi:hypothetical protein